MAKITVSDVRALLNIECDRAGSLRKWAKAHNIDKGMVSQVISGKRNPSDKILNALGLEWRIMVKED